MKMNMFNFFTGKIDELDSVNYETKTLDFRQVIVPNGGYKVQQKFYVPVIDESGFCKVYRHDKHGKIKISEIDLDLSEPFMDMHVIPYYLLRVEEWRFLPEVRLEDI